MHHTAPAFARAVVGPRRFALQHRVAGPLAHQELCLARLAAPCPPSADPLSPPLHHHRASLVHTQVRITNSQCLVQIVGAKVVGDYVLAQASSKELTGHGMPVSQTSYAACYATGLLVARRLLKTLKLDTHYVGQTEVDGEVFFVEEAEDGPRPFYALLDIGLARASTGARVFAALKGATDGGIEIPHSEKRFPGYAEGAFDASVMRGAIFGAPTAAYMKLMQEENAEKYNKHFSRFIKAGIKADDLEAKWGSVHASIRKNPERAAKKAFTKWVSKNQKTLSKAEKKARVDTKLAAGWIPVSMPHDS